MREFKAQQGFLTIAQNTEVDYLRLAYLQALSIKITMPGSLYAVIVDSKTHTQMLDKYHTVFDYVIELPNDYAKNDQWKLANEWQVFNLTPFKETVKLESDILFTRSINHWWTAFRLRDVVLSQGCKDYHQNLSKVRTYRKLFDDNQLPDVYNGLMYFRYSQQAHQFFELAKNIYANWDQVSTKLKGCDQQATTDVVYALTAKLLGVESTTLPLDFINFVHMKNSINQLTESAPWCEQLFTDYDLPMIRFNHINQLHPVHYQDKAWATDRLIEEYEHEYQR
jgi:hypothetical protein